MRASALLGVDLVAQERVASYLLCSRYQGRNVRRAKTIAAVTISTTMPWISMSFHLRFLRSRIPRWP